MSSDSDDSDDCTIYLGLGPSHNMLDCMVQGYQKLTGN